MEPQNPTVPTPPQPPVPPVSPIELPKPKKNNFVVVFLSVLLLVTLSAIAYLFLQVQSLTKQLAQIQVQVQVQKTAIPPINEQELSQGWYWGTENQKKLNTPDDWICTEAGKSSCWHKPQTNCASPF